MPSIPPFSRSERIEDYISDCGQVKWREKIIETEDRVNITLAIGRLMLKDNRIPVSQSQGRGLGKVEKEEAGPVILYFQGNGGSLPPRLPMLSKVMTTLLEKDRGLSECTLIAVSYRGYWTSKGRATESGLRLDAKAALQWVEKTIPNRTSLTIWGQSLGAGVAACLVADVAHSTRNSRHWIDALVLETPFISIDAMLVSLYPEKWLPYRYLRRFLWNHWNSQEALSSITSSQLPKLLICQAGKDEVVPAEHGQTLFKVCDRANLNVKLCTMTGALHNDVSSTWQGREAIASFIAQATPLQRSTTGPLSEK